MVIGDPLMSAMQHQRAFRMSRDAALTQDEGKYIGEAIHGEEKRNLVHSPVVEGICLLHLITDSSQTIIELPSPFFLCLQNMFGVCSWLDLSADHSSEASRPA